MRERRWESENILSFSEVLGLGRRLDRRGLKAAEPGKEIIVYVEEWTVAEPAGLSRLDPWPQEDVTMVHVREAWRGDFFLLAGAYHTVFRRHRGLGRYCSISHPWRIHETLRTHHPQGMLWVGFRDGHSFIRVRLHTTEVITPGETREDGRRALWVEERRKVFGSAIALLDLPIETGVEKGRLTLKTSEEYAALFCSWPDAFGPCQFEFNVPDAFEFLVPAGRLAATCAGDPSTVRAYLTGFSEFALKDFESTGPGARFAYRCSVHATLGELPDLRAATAPDGRIYTTLCEFQTQDLFPAIETAWVIIGVLGAKDGYRIEARLSRAPLPEPEMAGWLEALLGMPVAYAPLPPFP